MKRLARSEHATGQGQAYRRENLAPIRVPMNLEDNLASVLQKKTHSLGIPTFTNFEKGTYIKFETAGPYVLKPAYHAWPG